MAEPRSGGFLGFFSFKYGMTSTLSQSDLMQLLKSNGAECIQTSDGLCVKSGWNLAEVNSWLEQKQVSGVHVSEMSVDQAMASNDTPVDVKSFLQS